MREALDLLRQHWLWYYKHKAKDIVTSDWSDVQTKLDEWTWWGLTNLDWWHSDSIYLSSEDVDWWDST